MLQGIIARIANYGATLKNYCITLTTASCGFAITLQRPLVVAIAVLPILAFAALDTQYLRIEKRFRALYDAYRNQPWDAPASFALDLSNAPHVPYQSVLFSWSILSFYGLLLAGIVLLGIIMGVVHGRII